MKCGVCKKHQVIRVAANVRGKDYYKCKSCGWRINLQEEEED